MNSIIDHQQELRYDGIVLDKKWVQKRISDQFEYVIEVYQSDRSNERKLELIESAFGVVHNFVRMFPTMHIAFTTVCAMNTLMMQIEYLARKPIPKYMSGTIDMNLERGPEVITGWNNEEFNSYIKNLPKNKSAKRL